jgi:hypothetical protein
VPNPDFLDITYNQNLSNSVPVTANTTYSLSARVRANGSNATCDWAVRVYYYDSTGDLLIPFTDIASAGNVTILPTGQVTGRQLRVCLSRSTLNSTSNEIICR